MAVIRGSDRVDGYAPDRPEEFDATEDDAEAADQLERMLLHERTIVEECDNYYYGAHRPPYMPTESSEEYKELARRSITNMVPLIIGNLAQLLYIEGYLPSNANNLEAKSPPWRAWQANRMALKQKQLFRSALKYGVGYTAKTNENLIQGKFPRMRVISPSKIIVGYEDPVNDEHPLYALEQLATAKKESLYRLYRPDGSYADMRKAKKSGAVFEPVDNEGHSGLPYPPITRYVYDLDIDGRYVGEIRQIITLQDRLNQTELDRLLVQTFGSWKIRYATGLSVATEHEKMKLSKSRILVAEDPDSHFGSLPETSLDGFIKSTGVDQETIAAVSSIPPHYLTGELNNLGAEAIAEARASTEAKVGEMRTALGESVKQDMRDFGYLMGSTADAEDYEAQEVWADQQNRSLSQVADALGKLATMLNVPVTELWPLIPGFTPSDVSRWKRAREAEEFDVNARSAEEDGMEREDADTGDTGAPTDE